MRARLSAALRTLTARLMDASAVVRVGVRATGLRRSPTNDEKRSSSALGDGKTARVEGNPTKRRDDQFGLGNATERRTKGIDGS